MMREVSDYEFGRGGQIRTKYPWRTIFDGTKWELTQGEDYHCKTRSFVGLALDTAAKLGVTIQLEKSRDDKSVFVQAVN